MYSTRKAAASKYRGIILSSFVRDDVKYSQHRVPAREKDDVILRFIVKKVPVAKDHAAMT